MICALKIIEGPAFGLTFSLRDGETITVGRHEDASFCVSADQHISRKHVQIQWDKPHFVLRDLGSRNGTYLNGDRIATVNLTSGDRLNIGNSVFRITIEDETATKEMLDPPKGSGKSDIAAPQRKLSADNLQIDDETTHPFQMGAKQRADLFGDAFPAPKIEKNSDAGGFWDDKTELVETGFYSQFVETDNNLLWKQKPPASPPQAEKILDLLLAEQLDCRLSLVVNRTQLTSQGSSSEALLSFCSERALSETLVLLQGDTQSDVINFYRRCLTKDAAVCLATSGPLSDVWLRTAISSLSYPSLLYGVVQQSRGRTLQLAQGSMFVLFESNANGELCLLRKK